MQVSNNYNVINNVSVINNKRRTVTVNNNPSFKGIGRVAGNLNKGLMQLIERGGFFAEFCIMDTLGLVFPRVWQGFHRNQEELKHLNYQAGMEEFLREIITGPSMFIIPISCLFLAGKFLGKGTQINSKLLKQFSSSFKKLGQNVFKKDLPEIRKNFASKLFDDVFSQEGTVLSNATKKLSDFKTSFVENLTEIFNGKLSKKGLSEKENDFVKLISDMNLGLYKKENTFSIHGTNASDFFKDAIKYMEDVVHSTKLSVEDKNVKDTVEVIIDKITKMKENGRKLTCLAGTLSLAAFLSIIPKIYQLSNKNPALIGIDNKENNQ